MLERLSRALHEKLSDHPFQPDPRAAPSVQPPTQKSNIAISISQSTQSTSTQIFSPSATAQSPQNLPPYPHRTLHFIRPRGFLHRDLTILDSDNSIPLYSTYQNNLALTLSHLGLPRTHPFATAKFHGLNERRPTIAINSQPLTLTPTGAFARSFQFSTELGLLAWWRDSGHGARIVLVTESGEWIAKFQPVLFSKQEYGRIELRSWEIHERTLEEIPVTALVVIEVVRRIRMDS